MTDLVPPPASWMQSRDELPDEALRTARTMNPQLYVGNFVAPRIELPVRSQPQWLTRYAARLQELIDAGIAAPDWNGHGARPLQREAVELGLRVLAALYHGADGRPFPWIVPTFRGGLQCEWHSDGIELELDLDANGSVEVTFSDSNEQKEWDGTLSEREWEVYACLDRLAESATASADS